MASYSCNTPDSLPEIARALLPEILSYKTVWLNAPMGAGKTTLIKQICIALGVEEAEIHSPTYSLVNEYNGTAYLIFHFDLYRIKDISEAYDFGIEEYFDRGAICFFEWADLVEPLLPRPYLEISIVVQDGMRVFTTTVRD
jgi:tRNA threonylcarbamoyladenosine biosynthesis protein TsaE